MIGMKELHRATQRACQMTVIQRDNITHQSLVIKHFKQEGIFIMVDLSRKGGGERERSSIICK
jgi:hypothetical protein